MADRARGRACRIYCAAILAALILLPPAPAHSAEISIFPVFAKRADFFGGIDATRDSTFAWSGMTFAPRGRLDEDGFRVRLTGGTGMYRYRTGNVPGGINEADVVSGEILGGYRHAFGPVIASAYLGIAYEDQRLRAADASNPTQGSETGIKAAFDLYVRLWSHYIATAFVTGSTVHNKYHARATFLRELNERWAVGVEGGALGDARSSETRAGLVGTLTWRGKIFALSGGFADNSDKGGSSYATLSVYAPF